MNTNDTPKRYVSAIRGILDHLEQTQLDAIERAASLTADSVLSGGVVFCAGVGHSIDHDYLNRAGGPAFLQPLTFHLSVNSPVPGCRKELQPAPVGDKEAETIRTAIRSSNLRKGDIVVIGSVSGRNIRPVEIALQCQELGAKVIGLTSLTYTASVTSLHASGKKLAEVCDVVIDNGAPYGDAAVSIPGYDIDLLPVSGVSMDVAGWMLWGRAMEMMAERGTPASVFMSLNREGGQAYYDQSMARYQSNGY